ncbi:MAG: magnesium/cobalt efflux protein, partial [Gammaproteobacteria bacterium]|nr:magnesium/cobalt efflux protein [Gammaproteobacteria bacterium]
MTDDESSIDPRPKSWIDKLAQVFSDEPTDTKSLLELVRNAEADQVLDADALSIIEGALQVSNMQVRDIMIPRSQVITV